MSIITHEQAMGAQQEYKDKVMHLCLSDAGENYIFMADEITFLKNIYFRPTRV